MRIVLTRFCSSKDKWLELFESQYTEKINHLFPFEYHYLKSKAYPRGQREKKIFEEFKTLASFLKSEDQVIFFDEGGKDLKNSPEFCQFLVRHIESGKKRLVFVIGGVYGFSKEALRLAHHRIRLSHLTMSHQVAITMSMEQIYRALSIWKGRPYHNN